MKTYFLEKSHIITCLISIKKELLGEEFVTIKELNYISNKIQKRFNQESIPVIIIDTINYNYFNITSNVITNKVSFEENEYRYKSIPSLAILNILYDKSFILDLLLTLEEEKLNNLKSQKQQAKPLVKIRKNNLNYKK